MGEGLIGIGFAKLWLFLAAIAGSVTGTLMQKGLTLQGKLSAFFIGLTFTLFCGEFILRRIGLDITPEASFAVYIIAMSANNLVPRIIKRVSERFDDPLALTRKGPGQ